MTPEQRFKEWWMLDTQGAEGYEAVRLAGVAWHAALAYAAGELRKRASMEVETMYTVELKILADRLSPKGNP